MNDTHSVSYTGYAVRGVGAVGSRAQEQQALLTDYDNASAYSQAFYKLFANIRFHWDHGGQGEQQNQIPATRVHSLLLASASPWQDESIVAANLAIVAAQSGFEAVLVDADLHQPGLHKRFTLANRSGLGDLLESGDLTPEIIAGNLQTTFVSGLRFLSAGSALTPVSALLLSPRLEEVAKCIHDLLDTSEQKPGVIIYHSPSVLARPDASLLSAHVEQTVLAVITGKTTRQQAKQAQEQLQLAKAQLGGVILLKS